MPLTSLHSHFLLIFPWQQFFLGGFLFKHSSFKRIKSAGFKKNTLGFNFIWFLGLYWFRNMFITLSRFFFIPIVVIIMIQLITPSWHFLCLISCKMTVARSSNSFVKLNSPSLDFLPLASSDDFLVYFIFLNEFVFYY